MQFQALRFDLLDDGTHIEVKKLHLDDLSEGEVTVQVVYSSLNYKDALATLPKQILKKYPMTPGIDLAGTVIASEDARYKTGDSVIVTGYELGVTHDGGLSEVARVKGDWIVPLPEGLSLREAMVIGTAGFTAALSIHRLEENGLRPGQGPVLVTGATGGVGSLAVNMLANLGYEVAASTGKQAEHEFLRSLGARTIVDRSAVSAADAKPLRQQRWSAAIDPVGGKTLEYILSSLQYGGSVASSGLTGGHEVAATVFPFILRGVNWLGIDSVYCPMDVRLRLWQRLAQELKPNLMEDELQVQELRLHEVPEQLEQLLKSKVRGRSIVKL